MSTEESSLTPTLRAEYAAYRASQTTLFSHPEKTSRFFSPTCAQSCRPIPSFVASERDTIIGFMQASQKKPADGDGKGAEGGNDGTKKNERGWILRDLTPDEAADVPKEYRERKAAESWEGRRVVMWDPKGTGRVGKVGGDEKERRIVVVNYWWRWERMFDVGDGDEGTERWVQCLHDILFIGSEGDAPSGLVREGEVPL